MSHYQKVNGHDFEFDIASIDLTPWKDSLILMHAIECEDDVDDFPKIWCTFTMTNLSSKLLKAYLFKKYEANGYEHLPAISSYWFNWSFVGGSRVGEYDSVLLSLKDEMQWLLS